MGISPDPSQVQLQRDGFAEKKSDDGVGTGALPATSGSFSFDLSPSELPTLHDGNGTPSSQDPEKDAIELAGKYIKYAGEAPDGGLKAWSVVLATGLTCCVTFGYANAWGIFQAYYQEVMLPDNSPSDIAWIGSVQYALVVFPGLVFGRLFDIGYFKIPYLLASCLLIVCTFLIAECKVYWQFFLAQGLGTGLACGIMFGPAVGVISHWFSKRRGLALGVNALGPSIGGMAFPIAAQNLIPEVGFKWTMRIFGFMMIFMLGISILTIDRRLPPTNVKGGLFNWAALKNPAFAVYCLSGVVVFLGLYTVLTYIPVSAVQAGIPSNFSFYYIAIANGCSAFGRLSGGFLADRIGALNVMIPFTLVTAIATFVWPFVKNKSGLIAISVVYGFTCGTYASLLTVPAMAMGTIGDVGRRTGLFFSLIAFGALAGPPISGAINTATDGFEDVGWYGGATLILSACLMVLTRYLHLGKLTGKF